jgi:hypothetical protein
LRKINFYRRNDGKFSVYNSKTFNTENLLWSSDSLKPNQQANYLEIDNNGNLVGFNSDGNKVWQTMAFEDRQTSGDEESSYYLELKGKVIIT